ncbi:MAG: S-layer homology domain-containing protein, partial [Candidatus Peregrinibacteria bacterium]|nr:S-layer homology domain-containing protein [Candidatus Peregrinibacteria bacterium]
MWKKALAIVISTGLLIKFFKNEKHNARFLKRKIRSFHNFISKPIRKNPHSWKRFLRENTSSTASIAIVLISILYSDFLQDYSHLFRASLIEIPTVEFTGTVSPIEKVPNWTALSDAERTMNFSQLPTTKLIPLPKYDLTAMQAGQNYSGSTTTQRNTYITYPVPNLGNYKLDGSENSGSHTGVDIKTPEGTPIRAIAAGTVYKVDDAPTGYGKHIVIIHIGIPDPSDSSKKTTLYSGYAHMSLTAVREGDEVKKGQYIGKSGQSGMTTSPHLHFQIDKDSAPFHPYWPFSWDEVQAAGYSSYFDGVKYGVGKSNAITHTIHPINFVKSFENYVAPNLVATAGESITTTELKDEPVITPEVKDEPVDEPVVEKSKTKDKIVVEKNISRDDVEFSVDRKFIPGKEKVVDFYCKNCTATAGIEISSTLRHLADVEPKKLESLHFSDGIAKIKVKTDSNATFKLIATGDFGEVRSQSLRAQLFSDVEPGHKFATEIKYCKNEGIFSGYPDGTFKPEGTLNRAEAVKILIEGNKIKVASNVSNFPDVEQTAWFSKYVGTAVTKKIVKGYSDGTFKPSKTISRAEFLKIAVLTAGFNPDAPTKNPYLDVPKEE